MNPTPLLDHFDRLADATDAVESLRRLILDLAVRGRLVAQDCNDEPASIILDRIKSEKTQLERDGTIKKDKEFWDGLSDDPPHELPASWNWTRLQDLFEISRGGSPRPAGDPRYFGGPIPWITVREITKDTDKYLTTTEGGLTEEGATHSRFIDPDDLLLTNSGATLGVPKISRIRACINDGVAVLRQFHSVPLNDFAYLYLQSQTPVFRKVNQGMGQPNLNTPIIAGWHFPLPPLAEQHRIVAKVDELMSLCDRLEAAQAERENRRDRLVRASLHRLNQPADVETFRAQIHFTLENLPQLTNRPQHVPQLRLTIMDLAVRGRLTQQRPANESAGELLAEIHREKAVAGQSAMNATVTGTSDSVNAEDLFPIPANWRWVRLREIAVGLRYGTSVKCSYEKVGEPVLRIPNVENGRIDIEDLKFGPLSEREAGELRLRYGDILMVRSNGSLGLVGRPALVEDNAVGYCYAGYLVRVRTSQTLLVGRYLVLALGASHTRKQIEVPIRSTVGLKNVNATELGALCIPLPPLAEQNRIVAKVDELMALCDRLESQLTTAQTESGRLLEAVLHEALT